MIYGAYGYTGKLITELAVKKGLHPILAGRDETKTHSLAEKYQLSWKSFTLENQPKLLSILQDIDILMNVAGPYSKTATHLVNACIAAKTHYLDVTGEIEVFEWIASKNEAAQKAGITLLPGCGFDVVPSDCLAAILKTKMPDATHLSLAFKGVSSFSRGTALTMLENVHKGGKIRENGIIKEVSSAHKTREVFLKNKNRLAVSIPWGDVSTAFYSTGIPNIIVYMATNAQMIKGMKMTRYFGWFVGMPFIQNILASRIKATIDGPSETNRKNEKSYLWGEVKNRVGNRLELYLETPEGYQLTALTAVKIIQKLAKEPISTGFLTPSKAFGEEFILEIPNTQLKEA